MNAERLSRKGERLRALYALAVYRALGGDTAGARLALQRAVEAKVSWLQYVTVDPVLGHIQSE